MAQTKAQLIDGKGDVDLGALSISGSAPDNSVNLDASGRLLVGTSSAIGSFQFAGSSRASGCQIVGDTVDTGSFAVVRTTTGPVIYMGAGTSGLNVAANDALGYQSFHGYHTNAYYEGARITAHVDGTPGANDMPGRLVFSTTADGASSPTERMRIKSDGNINIGGGTTGTYRVVIRVPDTTQTSGSLVIENSSAIGSVYFFNVSGTGVNTNSAAMWIEKNTSTNRSINAGGTVNASGADYAEYMVKASDFIIAKGDICGVTADGLLTTDYTDAVSFVVKSTNPSYVGGDTWGSEDVVGKKPEAEDSEALVQWESDLEAARQKVDRIAFAGQVPVNVMSATPGQYIIPVEAVDGGIEGVAKNEADLTLAEYMRAVGKVIAIEDDGRARIIVKVA